MSITKERLPKGRITVKKLASRDGYQAFAGVSYLHGCFGAQPMDALFRVGKFYRLPDNAIEVTVYGYSKLFILPLQKQQQQ